MATVALKITSQKPASFYVRSAATFLRGTETKGPVPELSIVALGNAIPAAVQVASAMERSSLGSIAMVNSGYTEMESGSRTVSVPQITITVVSSASSPQFEAVGGHDDSIVFEGTVVWKKIQSGGRGEDESAFVERAATVPVLNSFVPKFHGYRTFGEDRYFGMDNLLHGLREPAILDLKMGTRTWASNATPEKIKSQSGKAAKSTTGKIGVRIVGGKYRLVRGGEWQRNGYKNDKEAADEAEVTEELARFLCSDALRQQAAKEVDRLSAWFTSQREFAFYASSLLLAYDTTELPNPEELRFTMIDFAHVEEPTPEGGDQSYITGLDSMQRMLRNLSKL